MENTNDLKTEMPSDKKTVECYSIFNYFKEHPSIAIALFSGLLALGTFIAEVCYTIENNAFFEYWDLSLSNVSAKSFVQGNTVIFTLLQSSFQTVFSFCILFTFDIHISNFSHMIYLKCIRKELSKDFKKAKKRIALYRRKCDTIPINSTNEECLKSDYKEIMALEKEMEQAISQNQLLGKELNEVEHDSLSIIFAQTIIPVVLYFFLTWITLSIRTTSITKLFSSSLICTCIPLIFACCNCGRKIKRIKKQARNDHKNDENLFVKKDYKNYPGHIFFRNSLREMLPNHVIVSLLMSLFLVFVVSLFLTSIMIPITIHTLDEYPIVTADDVAYIVIYETSDKMILEEAVITDSTVIIDTQKQWIVNKENVHYEIQSFEKVMRLKDCADINAAEESK